MAFGLFGLSRLMPGQRNVQNLQAPQATIGMNAPQIPGRARRAVITQAGNGNIGGTPDVAAPGSQSMDGLQMSAGRPRQIASPASLPESTGTGFGQEMLRSVTPQVMTPEMKTKVWEAYTPGGVSASGFVPNQYIPASPDSARPVYDPESLSAINALQPTESLPSEGVRRARMVANVDAYSNDAPRPRRVSPASIKDLGFDQSSNINNTTGTPTNTPGQPNRLPLLEQDLGEYDRAIQRLEQRGLERQARFDQLQGELPSPVDAEQIANQEVAKKGKLWRLGQLGLGMLKGFAGLNQDGGSGLLGAISGGVSGATGDLYRRKRVAGIEGEQAEALDIWDRKAKAFDQYADTEYQLDRAQNAALSNKRKAQDEYNDLINNYNKGLITYEQLQLNIKKVAQEYDIAQARVEEMKNQRLSKESEGEKNRASRESMNTERVVGANARAATIAGAAANRQNRAIEARKDLEEWKAGNKPKKDMPDDEAKAHAYSVLAAKIEQEQKKIGQGRKDTDIYETLDIAGSPFPVTVQNKKNKIAADLKKIAKEAEPKILDNIKNGRPPFYGVKGLE